MTYKDNGLEFTLETFVADRLRARTECGFRVWVNGQDTLAWRPVALEVADATGNHWRPELDPRLEHPGGNPIMVGFYGALWPEEDAWKLRVKFKHAVQVPGNVLPPVVPAQVVEFLANPEQTSSDSEPSPRLAKLICDCVARGMPYAHACAVAGISVETLCAWRNRDPQFQAMVEQAVAHSGAMHSALGLALQPAGSGDFPVAAPI